MYTPLLQWIQLHQPHKAVRVPFLRLGLIVDRVRYRLGNLTSLSLATGAQSPCRGRRGLRVRFIGGTTQQTGEKVCEHGAAGGQTGAENGDADFDDGPVDDWLQLKCSIWVNIMWRKWSGEGTNR